jgi:two-component system LytT family response regulator
MRALIVDDEKNARLALVGILNEHFDYISIVAESNDIPSAVKAIHKYQPELIFLDISMPGYSGLELFKFFEADEITFKVIFVTAHSEYAVNAFELSAVDYILKPIQISSLERAIKKISEKQYQPIELLQQNFNSQLPKKVALQTGEGTEFLKFDDIIYLKADGSYTHFITDHQRKIIVTRRIADFERLQTMGSFLRIHRSHIINYNRISRILKQDGGWVVMDNGDELSISNERKTELINLFEAHKL